MRTGGIWACSARQRLAVHLDYGQQGKDGSEEVMWFISGQAKFDKLIGLRERGFFSISEWKYKPRAHRNGRNCIILNKMRIPRVTKNFSEKRGNQEDIFHLNKTNVDWGKAWSWKTVSYSNGLRFNFQNWSGSFRNQLCALQRERGLSLKGQRPRDQNPKGQIRKIWFFPIKKGKVSCSMQVSSL